MAYNGHQTRSIFERYNVVSEGDLQEQAAKLQAFLGANGAEEGPRRDQGGEAKSEGETAEDKAG